MKKYYQCSISLRCITCGDTHSFETNKETGVITCTKCNRVYNGGRDELEKLNNPLVEQTKDMLVNEVKTDVEREFAKLLNHFK